VKLNTKEKKLVYQWMLLEIHADDSHYKGNITQFVENCAHDFNHDEWLDDPDHWVWEMALEFFPDD
jgi:hypothetical protein